jgi:hypothetical protein
MRACTRFYVIVDCYIAEVKSDLIRCYSDGTLTRNLSYGTVDILVIPDTLLYGCLGVIVRSKSFSDKVYHCDMTTRICKYRH